MSSSNYRASVICGIAFGDEAKGSVVDYLCRQATNPTVVRFNGGHQAAHNVVLPDGTHHTFSQFGSGTLAGARTHLSRYMLVEPMAMENEAEHLRQIGVADPYSLLAVDEECVVVTPFHRAANRIREAARGDGRHGSCGLGIGEAASDALTHPDETVRWRGLYEPKLAEKLATIRDRKRIELKDEIDGLLRSVVEDYDIQDAVDSVIRRDMTIPAHYASFMSLEAGRVTSVKSEHLAELVKHGDLIFEGAQGALLDEDHGFHPYTTWSKTTTVNALALLKEIGYEGQIEKLGVVRTYFTRHGPGPFPTEDATLAARLKDAHNGEGRWQGGMRYGHFDALLAKYAIAVCGGIDGLAVTHADAFAQAHYPQFAHEYVTDEHNISAISGSPTPRSLEHQTAITDRLMKVSRTLNYYTRGDEAADFIADELHIPLRLVSHGPTWREKKDFRLSKTVVE